MAAFLIVIIVIGSLACALGCVFLATGVFAVISRHTTGLLPGAILFFGGGGAVYLSVKGLTRLRETSPEFLKPALMSAARDFGGRMTLREISSELGISSIHAGAVVNYLIGEKQCVVEDVGEETTYFFPDAALPPEVTCRWCGETFRKNPGVERCPHCGGNIEIE